MKRNLWKRTVSLLMSVVMLMSLMVVPAQAEGTGAPADAAGAPVQASQQEAPAAAAGTGTVTGAFKDIVTECPEGVTVEVKNNGGDQNRLLQNEAKTKWFLKATQDTSYSPALAITVTIDKTVARGDYALIFDYAVETSASVKNNFGVENSDRTIVKELYGASKKVNIETSPFQTAAINLKENGDKISIDYRDYANNGVDSGYLTNVRIVRLEKTNFTVTLPDGVTAIYSDNGEDPVSLISGTQIEVAQTHDVKITATIGAENKCMQGFYRSGDTVRLSHENEYTFVADADPAKNKYEVRIMDAETVFAGYENLTVKTEGTLGWTQLADGSLASGNQMITGSSSPLSITANKAGTLMLDYKVSSEAWDYDEWGDCFTGDGLVYAKGTAPDFNAEYGEVTGAWDNADEMNKFSGIMTKWETLAIPVSAEETVYFLFCKDAPWSGDETFAGEDTAWIRNIFLSSGEEVMVEVKSSNESCGTVSGDNLNKPVSEGSKQTYTATPKDGCQFYGWFDGSGKLLSLENTYTCVAKKGITLVAKFGNYEAWNMDTGELGELASVVQEARSGDTVLLTEDTTISADLTIPAGVTLVVPCTEDDKGNNSVRGDAQKGEPPCGIGTGSSDIGRNGTLYRTLAIESGKTLTVKGTLVVNAVIGRQGRGHYDYDINGGYGRVVNHGTIDIRSGGAVDAFGLVEGADGNVIVRSGAILTDLFVIINWRGGTQASAMNSAKIYPMNEYKADNISSTITIHSGASYRGLTRIYARVFISSKYTSAYFTQVNNDDGIIRLKAGSTLTRKVENGRERFTINGGAVFAGSSLNVGISLTTTKFIYPFNGTYDFELKNGEYAFTEDFKFMPGATVTTSKANLTVNEGKTVVFYDAFDDINKTAGSAAQYPHNRPAATLTLSDDSTLTINGTFAGTVVSGLNKNNIKKGAQATLGATTKEAAEKYETRELTFNFIPSTFGGYTGGWVNNVYTWEKDKYTITFNTDGGDAIENRTVAWGETLTLPIPTKTGYTFAGWYNGETKFVAKVMPSENLTLTARWTANTNTAYTVEHYYETLTDGYDVETVRMTGTTGEQTMAVVKDKAGFTAGTVTQRPIAADGSTVVKIYYTRNSYTLKWNFDGGKENATGYTTGTVKFGAAINKPSADPTKTGYTFAKWDKYTDGMTMPANNLTIKAKWTINQYTVTFMNGDVVVKNAEMDYGSTIIAPEKPTKEGYTFKGWQGYTTNMTVPARNVIFTAQWKINQYTLTFDPANGDEKTVITQNYGTAIIAPKDPTKTGYTFDGWDKTIPTTMPAENVIVKAQWTINKYTITFNTDGGSEVESITQDYGTKITAPAAPTKTGYTFAGWDRAIPGTMPAENMTVKATWTINQYTIAFDTDGGSEVESITQDYGTEITAPADPTKTGYTFTGWDKTIPTTMPAKNMTIKAKWTINQYTVTFKNGETVYKTITQDYGTAIAKPADPTKTGYTFAGWDKNIPTTMPAGDMTITAKWTANQYTVKFDSNGGEGTMEAMSFTYDVEQKLTKNSFTRAGYNFTGWKLGTDSYGDETTVKNLTAGAGATVTLVAQWGINRYTVSFDTDGGTTIAPITQDYGTAIIAPKDPTKTGYTFAGWDKEIPEAMPAENMTITAQWTINQYTITFNTAGGSDVAAITQDYGAAIAAPANPTKTGYTFAGWDKEIPETMPAENLTIKAQWKINKYTITFDTAGGSAVASITQDYGTAITAPANPAKEGYTFAGWSEKIPGRMPAENMTVKAQWKINQYTITFKNGETVYKTITQDYGTAITKPADPTKTGYTFAGWDKEIPEAMPAGDMTVTAKWTVNKYTVTFDANSGSACKEITITYDGKYPTLPAPTKEGYTFEGWFDGKTQVMSGTAVTITEDQTLTARWGINTYTITYQVDGQTVKTESVTYGEDIPAYTYTKIGYDVSAWSPAAPEKMPARNLTFTATTKVHRHSLTYVLDGEMKSQAPVNYGTAVAVQADPTKTGYTFSGWKVEGATAKNGKFTMPDNNVTITGSFSANTYTVTFNANGGEGSMADQSFTYDAEQDLAANGFTRTGWRFTGWKLGNTTYTDGHAVSNLTAEANGTVTLEAQWEHILYTLKYVGMAGTVYHTEQKYYGDAITPPEAPEKAGYRFDGWDREIPATMPDGNLTITAKWSSYLNLLIAMGDDFAGEKLGIARGYYQKMNGDQRGDYSVETAKLYNAFVTAVTNASVAALEKNVAGAVVPTNEKLLIEGKQIAELTLNGYDVETRLIAEDYPAVKLTTVDFLTVLFGYGEIASVKVGDQPEVSFKDGTGGKQMELMLAVARQAGVELQDSAHTYISVLDGKSMPVKVNGKTEEGITYSVTYQLSFFNNTHKITWNANGGVGGTTTTGTYGKAITAPTVTRVGYTFAGWDKAIPETMGKTALTFTAQWTANTDTAYTVQHHYETLTGGYDVETVPMTGTTGEQTMAVVKDKAGFTAGTVAQATIAANGSTVVNIYYTRNSYTLTVDADNGTAVSKETYKFGTAIIAPAAPTKTGYTFAGWSEKIPETMPAENMTVKAQWKINQYTITFDTDGGSAVASITQDYGTTIAKPTDPTKTGYTFGGWDKTIPDTMPAEDVTVTATWKINQYTITFDTDGGSKIDPITQDYGTAIIAPAAPTKTGYTFGGWDKTIPDTMPAGDMTIKATWTINKYTITFDTDGGSEIAPITQDYGTTIAKPTDPTKTGYTFAGWYTDAACTNAWNFGSNMLTDHDMTLYARWVRNAVRKATITGSVELGNRPAVGAVVELMLGNRKIAAATTDANGVYSFQTVETGLYNIVAAKDGKTRTALVNVDSAGSYTVDMIVLPGTDVSFEVRIEMPATPPAAGSEPKADVSKTTVGGLDAVADKYAESGKKVALLLTVTPKTAEEVDAAVRAAIEERSAGQKIEFVDMTLSKSVDDAPATTISSTGDRLLTINIPFATSGVSVGSMAAYRCIDGKVETLTSTPNADGEFIEVRGGVLVVHTGKPATYAIGYRLRSGSSYGGTYSLTSGDGQNGKAGATLQFGVNSGGTKVSAVYVDGTQLGGSDYTVKGTIVRLKGVYTATLVQGYHFGTVYYDNGYVANFSFTLSGETSPRTADMGIGLYAALALTSLTGMAWVGKRRGSGRES